jgi:hypothetical protein
MDCRTWLKSPQSTFTLTGQRESARRHTGSHDSRSVDVPPTAIMLWPAKGPLRFPLWEAARLAGPNHLRSGKTISRQLVNRSSAGIRA